MSQSSSVTPFGTDALEQAAPRLETILKDPLGPRTREYQRYVLSMSTLLIMVSTGLITLSKLKILEVEATLTAGKPFIIGLSGICTYFLACFILFYRREATVQSLTWALETIRLHRILHDSIERAVAFRNEHKRRIDDTLNQIRSNWSDQEAQKAEVVLKEINSESWALEQLAASARNIHLYRDAAFWLDIALPVVFAVTSIVIGLTTVAT